MAKIRKDSISDKDLFGNIKTSAEEAITPVELLSDSLSVVVDLAKKLKEGVSVISPKNLKELNNFNQLNTDANQLLGIKIKLDNEIKKITVESNVLIKKNNAEIANSIKVRKADEEIKKKSLQTEKELIKNLEAEQKVEQQLNKTLQEVEKTKIALIKTEEVRVKQEKRIQVDREKEIKALLLAEKKELDAYQKKSKRLNQLRKRYKSLLTEQGKTTKESRKLGREVKKLDKELKDVDKSAGQFQRNVGDYPETLGDVSKSLLLVAGSAIAVGSAFNGVNTSLNSTVEGSENVRELSSALSGSWDQLKNVISATTLDLFEYSKAQFDVVFSNGVSKESIDVLSDSFSRTGKATDDFSDKMEASIKGQIELTKRIIAFEKAIRPLELRISSLNGLIQEQQIIAGDSTRSFQELENAVLRTQLLQIEKSQLVVKIAKEELSIVKERIALKNQAGGAGVELLNQETEALVKLKEAQIELTLETLENEKELRQIKQDRLERDLDILIDGFDNQKTINERIIANEKETLEKRSALLLKTNKLANDSFREQKEVLENLSNANIDIDALLLLDATELQKQIRLLEQSEIIEGRTLEVVRERRLVLLDLREAEQDLQDVKFEALELQKDILSQEEALKQLSLDSGIKKDKILLELDKKRAENEIENLKNKLDLIEKGTIEELRLKQELNDALLDLDTQQQSDTRYDDLLDANEEYLIKLETQLLKAGKSRSDINKELASNRVINLKQELDLLIEIHGESSREVLEKDLELQQALEGNFKKEEVFYDERKAVIEGFTDVVLENADKRIAKIDEEISAAQKQANLFSELAANGLITAKESLAEQNNLIAEAEAEKARIEQRKVNIELISSVVLGYNSALENGDNTPAEALKEALLGTTGIKAFISALPTFFEGTDNTGTHGQGIDGKGGFKAILHPNERVLTSEHNDLIGNISNDEVAKIMFDYRTGNMAVGNNIVIAKNDNKVLEGKVDIMTEAIKNIPQNKIELGEITQHSLMIKQTQIKGNTTTTTRFKVK